MPGFLQTLCLELKFSSVQVYLYSAFYDTIVAKQLYRKLSFYNIFIYCRNLIYLTYDIYNRTLLPGFCIEPENLSISHQSSGPYTGFQLHLGLIVKYFYSFINHSMA